MLVLLGFAERRAVNKKACKCLSLETENTPCQTGRYREENSLYAVGKVNAILSSSQKQAQFFPSFQVPESHQPASTTSLDITKNGVQFHSSGMASIHCFLGTLSNVWWKVRGPSISGLFSVTSIPGSGCHSDLSGEEETRLRSSTRFGHHTRDPHMENLHFLYPNPLKAERSGHGAPAECLVPQGEFEPRMYSREIFRSNWKMRGINWGETGHF